MTVEILSCNSDDEMRFFWKMRFDIKSNQIILTRACNLNGHMAVHGRI